MERLTEQAYWNSVNSGTGGPSATRMIQKTSLPHRIGRAIFGENWVLTWRSFGEFDFWQRILPRFVRNSPGQTVIEVGSAPGMHLVEFRERFGHDPYGIEYTPSGVASNRRTFVEHGLDPDHIMEGDFFSDAFQQPHQNEYDVVLSRGFIEHFTDMEKVIQSHVHILKPGGLLIVNIPNLNGLNRWMVKRFVPELLPIHNLTIMNLPVYRKLFEHPDLEQLYCAYQGGLYLTMGAADETRVPPLILMLLRRSQMILNFLQLGTGPLNTRWTSPNLLYIGRKR